MDWLMDNAIANMYGPHFLLLYGGVIILTLAGCWFMLRRHAEPFFVHGDPSERDVSEGAEIGDWPIRLAGASVIVGLGGYKLLVALAKGRHNVGFLAIMCIVALCILFTMSSLPRARASN